jgi:hypothetical protein
MKSLINRTQIFFAGLFMPLFVWATEPGTVGEATGMLAPIWEAIKNGKYLLAGAGVTLVLVFAFRKFLMDKLGLGTGVLPLVSAGIGILSAIASSLWLGASLPEAGMAVLAGPAAGLLWDAVIKYFVKK